MDYLFTPCRNTNKKSESKKGFYLSDKWIIQRLFLMPHTNW